MSCCFFSGKGVVSLYDLESLAYIQKIDDEARAGMKHEGMPLCEDHKKRVEHRIKLLQESIQHASDREPGAEG